MDAIEFDQKQVVRDLIVNIVTLVLCGLLQLVILLLRGPSHVAWGVYVGATVGLLAVAWISLLIAWKNRIPQAMHLYAWSGMIALLAMTASGMDPGEDLPTLPLVLICAGTAWLYSVLNWPSALVYTIGAFAAFVGLGAVYNQFDETVMASLFLMVSYGVGARLWIGNRANTAVRTVTNNGRRPGSRTS